MNDYLYLNHANTLNDSIEVTLYRCYKEANHILMSNTSFVEHKSYQDKFFLNNPIHQLMSMCNCCNQWF